MWQELGNNAVTSEYLLDRFSGDSYLPEMFPQLPLNGVRRLASDLCQLLLAGLVAIRPKRLDSRIAASTTANAAA